MRVLAIDPGTRRMGYGVVDAEPTPEADDYGVIALPASMTLDQRLQQLHTHILNMINLLHPDAIAVEDPFVGRGERAFAKSALAIGQAQAVVLIGAASQGVPVHRYAPARVKRAVTDYGGATKEQVQQMTVSTLRLREMPESDAADALAVGLCHIQEMTADDLASREIKPGEVFQAVLVGVRGTLEAVGADWVNVQVGGIVLQVNVPASAAMALGNVGDPVRLHTVLRIQNEQPALYGFPDAGSVELFGALNGVNGVGPRSAMAILSELGEDGFRQAVASEDVAALARAQGVGRRIAQRVVLELRGKLPDAEGAAPGGVIVGGTDAEAVEALTALGMPLADARQAVAALELPSDASVEEKIRQALVGIGGG